ncbi:hypothetical protein Tdes44962_MAKER10164 [Teratosphaeria destructans]|uniref:Uncharacterized protein n=1 Tax=Teratosphaeria destructans TaxID=418781 RepID=A0A9W7SMZ8_9PEZI|nr:hypothetical protein Tdes44962_MAKER10164 [Teratosphaeria destructans]
MVVRMKEDWFSSAQPVRVMGKAEERWMLLFGGGRGGEGVDGAVGKGGAAVEVVTMVVVAPLRPVVTMLEAMVEVCAEVVVREEAAGEVELGGRESLVVVVVGESPAVETGVPCVVDSGAFDTDGAEVVGTSVLIDATVVPAGSEKKTASVWLVQGLEESRL